MVLESKSFKLYLMGYRNFGTFHEAVVDRIANHLVDLLDPIRLTVKGESSARGGISFHPIATYAREEEARSAPVGR
jgi:7-cyano-7-deazaguanine reductase